VIQVILLAINADMGSLSFCEMWNGAWC